MPRSINTITASYWLAGLTTVEVLAQTYGFRWGYPVISSVLYLPAGLGIALLPLWKWDTAGAGLIEGRYGYWVIRAFLLVLISYICWRTPGLIAAAPLDYRQADMLPVIQTMGQRWLAGEPVYVPIEAIWGGMRPIYLPAMWLPYTFSLMLHVDIRWMSTLAVIVTLCLIVLGNNRSGNPYIRGLPHLALLPIVFLIYYIFGRHATLITLSEEPVVVFYYLLLAWALLHQRPVVLGMAIALCLLSRYLLLFWVPMFIGYQFFYQSRKMAYLTATTLILTLFFLLTIGQAWDQLSFFLHLQNEYLTSLLDEDHNWGFIAQIQNNPGLIKFLPYSGIASWHRLLIYGSALIPVLSIGYFHYRREQLDERFFGLCSLKLSMVYFYNMLTIPYSYLFYPSVFLSIFILFAAVSGKKQPAVGNFSNTKPVG